ncbi:hypothetical protein VTJ49DRAFT_336 [Mycothermus thermophilus]|uniref:polynucleotide adenylyltransferase n=1 Tax=Humicola insolens TaxID=85995 RepID=A0ABR3VFT4_HUMIN
MATPSETHESHDPSPSSSSSIPPQPRTIPITGTLQLTSTDTALTLIPPPSLWPRVDRLRALYDKAYLKWPPHVNLVYPFVRPDVLEVAVARVARALRDGRGEQEEQEQEQERHEQLRVRLDRVGVFERGRRENTIYLGETQPEGLKRLREVIVAALEEEEEKHDGKSRRGGRPFTAHMTIAQSEDAASDSHRFLVEKVGWVPAVAWTPTELAVLVRQRDPTVPGGSVMRLWGTVGLADGEVRRLERLGGFYEGKAVSAADTAVGEEEEEEEGETSAVPEKDALHSSPPYYFDDEMDRWVPFQAAATLDEDDDDEEREALSVASYNVLAEFTWPASEARYPLVVENILSENATADVLVLQEVTDGFLAHLLADPRIRDAYPYCSHGPPAQDDVDPLPSYLNIVVLSKTPFDWDYISLNRKHKGAVVARFRDVGRVANDGGFLPLVLAAVHLSQGLTDGAVAAKKSDIRRIIGYLAETYPGHPWILAGDFNVTTSAASIGAALRKKTLSEGAAQHLASLDELFAEAKLQDVWRVMDSKEEDGKDDEKDDEEEREGEQGATWDPGANALAAAMAAAGGGIHPQRYDRILVRGEGLLRISSFNMFGFLTEKGEEGEMFASDHWGIRCTMEVRQIQGREEEEQKEEEEEEEEEFSTEISSLVVPVHPQKAPEHLSAPGSVEAALASLSVIPSQEDTTKREQALELLKQVILDTSSRSETLAQPTVVVVPVGSYALGVWTSSSDMDVMCIGPFSAHTFFSLASQRLRRAAASGSDLRILRRVRAHTGTMLELQVCGLKVDLQYCPAAAVAQSWPEVLTTPPSDDVWSLSAPTLSKLKAARDIDYIRRSVPDLTSFRLAHRFIKTWAKARGIYSARFGFLSGIQISILLARVHKLLAFRDGQVTKPGPSVEDLLTTFFAHYADFDWARDLAFDPLFHRRRLPYTRTSREPLAILGYFPPALNTAMAASVPSAKTIAAEFARARDLLLSSSSADSAIPSWSAFLSSPNGKQSAADDFLTTHPSFIRIDVQYWGLGLARGAQLLGWLESRCVMLLVDLQRRAPGLHARMWPARFVEKGQQQGKKTKEEEEQQQEPGADGGEDEAAAAATRDFGGCYLIGLSRGRPDMSRDEVQLALGALQAALARFETSLRGDERYFDARCCWLGASVVARGELGELELDEREWGEYNPGEDEYDDDDEEEEEEEEEQGGEDEATSGKESDSAEDGKKTRKGGKKGKKKGAKKPIAVADMRADKTRKFRTAADAMNRIRWDPQLDSSDYVVGYEDRFVGAMEKDLAAWKNEQTDEEFIPQHRILYFRRKSDGRVVWDRRKRWDELFGNV